MKISRRGFFTSAISVLSFGLLSSLVNAEEKRRARPAAGADKAGTDQGPLSFPLVDPKDPSAQPMNYVEKHSDVKKAEVKMERQGVKFEAQYCKNCGFYKEVGDKAGTKVGTCTIFPNKLVQAEAWCSSWNKKA